MANNNEQHIFFLTYDLQIGFYKILQVINTTKLYDYKSKNFIDYDKTDNPFETSYHPNQNTAQSLINIINVNKYSILLNEEDMSWYKEVEELYSENKKIILRNKDILYNYLILKCKLCGFSEEFSISFIRHLFKQRKKEKIDLSITIEKLENIILSKKIWIPYVFYEDLLQEKDIIYKIIEQRQKDGFNFDFMKSFGKQYLEVVKKSFIYHTYIYNKEKNYLSNQELSLKEQEEVLFHIYSKYTRRNIKEILESNYHWKRLSSDVNFINRLVVNLTDNLKLSMKAWEL